MAHHEVSPAGRHGGRLTSRPLPDAAEIAALAPAHRALIAESWAQRGAMERRVVDAFIAVRDALVSLAAGSELVSLADRAIDDELRHAALCRVVASMYAGRELEEPARLVLQIPAHDGASEKLRHVLHVVGHCAINETFASSVLEHSLREARCELARAALRELLSDEIDHARIGFGLVASLAAADKRSLSRWLSGLCRASVLMWRSTPRAESDDPALIAHGVMSPQMIEQAVLSAARDIIGPGFEHLGVDASGVITWLDRGAR